MGRAGAAAARRVARWLSHDWRLEKIRLCGSPGACCLSVSPEEAGLAFGLGVAGAPAGPRSFFADV